MGPVGDGKKDCYSQYWANFKTGKNLNGFTYMTILPII